MGQVQQKQSGTRAPAPESSSVPRNGMSMKVI